MRLARSPVAPNRTKTAGRAAGSGCCIAVTTPPSYIPARPARGRPSSSRNPYLPVQDEEIIWRESRPGPFGIKGEH